MIDYDKENCPQFSPDFCEDDMCADCGCSDKNWRLEWHKNFDICPKCHGLQIMSRIKLPFISFTIICNVCGGTGSFPRNS